MQLVSISAFARRANVNISAVQKALKNGRISKYKNTGKIDLETQFIKWEQNRDISKIRNISFDLDYQSEYRQAKIIKEIYTAKLKELEYKKISDILVEKKEVEREMFKFFKIVRDTILAIPTRISSKFAVQTISYIKFLIVEHCGEETAENIVKEINVKGLESIAFDIWEKESREVLEKLGDNNLSSQQK